MELIDILTYAVEQNASDVHLAVGKPPLLRAKGSLKPMPQFPALTEPECQRLIYSALYDHQKQRFEQALELDCAFTINNLGRFRVNVLKQINGIEAVMRIVPSKIPDPEEIGLPEVVVDFTKQPRGLILVTGPTGAGKSTTLACLIEHINAHRDAHILTIEDPVEYLYTGRKSLIRQREVGHSTHSFGDALKHALRQDPDIILVGEMRDLETISLTLTAAETGHLCFATLHTTDAATSIDRIIDVFPPHQQQQIRVQLSTVLKGVVCQTLLPMRDGWHMVAVREVMVMTPAIANLVREGKTYMISNSIDTGAELGMVSMDKALSEAVKRGDITLETAVQKSSDPKKLQQLIGDKIVF
ncbi:MAG TPA: type IV pilus twitching motility protein PilT [Elusimicrobiota bacterium]|nr:type IV pilus twitching motility protein PilT [Elusimicrobiota bacterium]